MESRLHRIVDTSCSAKVAVQFLLTTMDDVVLLTVQNKAILLKEMLNMADPLPIATNPYSKPWKIEYVVDGETGSDEIIDGEKVVRTIVDCDGTVIIETDHGFYGPSAKFAEYLVQAVNMKEDN